MHDDLKALLRSGWSFGLHCDAQADLYRAVGRRGNTGENVVRATAAYPLEALAQAMADAQIVDEATETHLPLASLQ